MYEATLRTFPPLSGPQNVTSIRNGDRQGYLHSNERPDKLRPCVLDVHDWPGKPQGTRSAELGRGGSRRQQDAQRAHRYISRVRAAPLKKGIRSSSLKHYPAIGAGAPAPPLDSAGRLHVSGRVRKRRRTLQSAADHRPNGTTQEPPLQSIARHPAASEPPAVSSSPIAAPQRRALICLQYRYRRCASEAAPGAAPATR